MLRHLVSIIAPVVLVVSIAPIAVAQGSQDGGARAGGAYVPSTHTKGCGGLLCDADDPARAPGAPPPPACGGLLCSLTPYSMGRPVSAAEAQRAQEQARPPAVASETPARAKRAVVHRRHKATKPIATGPSSPTRSADAASRPASADR